ncbi:MAG: hypothetical protein CFH06_01293 [Alphaproteobacteria bacterium MarineAlpha3_Bin5]|nr:flagellar motor protein MotA [Magnetovibrio sp.]PPR77402.1 MAG: hypothetical protein CFH06_01293 [Alphaproteobacteria bacterium MarineAlpha3_Bin5]
MTRPTTYLFRMIIFLCAVSVGCFFLIIPIYDAFIKNVPLNGLILGVLALGIAYNFRNVVMLYPEVSWINAFRKNISDSEGAPYPSPQTISIKPRLLAPMAAMLADRSTVQLSLSTLAMRSLLDGIVSRLDEHRDISRYSIGLLIFLGLLGTFWGLLETVGSIGDVIGGLTVAGDNNISMMFETLKLGLEAPMSGMGTAFSSSLFGLAGSLVLGFLDLQANQAQNRFYNSLEDWLSSVTKLSSGVLGGEGESAVPAYVQALLEQTAESLERLQHTIARGEESRIAVNDQISLLNQKLEVLADHIRIEQSLMKNLAENQIDIKPILVNISDRINQGNDQSFDDATREHIRSIDLSLSRLANDLTNGRSEITSDIKNELRLLARTIAAGAETTGGLRKKIRPTKTKDGI